jgi:hypothetical protein
VLPTAAGLVVLKDGLPLWTTREFGEESSGKTRPGVARPITQSCRVDGKSLTDLLGLDMVIYTAILGTVCGFRKGNFL